MNKKNPAHLAAAGIIQFFMRKLEETSKHYNHSYLDCLLYSYNIRYHIYEYVIPGVLLTSSYEA